MYICQVSLLIYEMKCLQVLNKRPEVNLRKPELRSQIPKSRDVTLFFFRHDALQVSGHALFTSTPHVFLLNIFINKTERSIHFY